MTGDPLLRASAATRIRLAAEADMPDICSIVNHYIATTTVNFRTQDQTAGEWTDDWRAHSDYYPWLVAETDDDMLGFAYAAPWKARNAYDWTVESTIYLRPAAHGRGLARRLYGELVTLLAAQGYRTVLAVIGLPNEASVALHERCGYRHAGTITEAGFKMGRWLDVGFWQLPLTRPAGGAHEIVTVATAITESRSDPDGTDAVTDR